MQDPELREILGGMRATLVSINERMDRMYEHINRVDERIDSITGNRPPPEYNDHIHCWQKKFRLSNGTFEKWMWNSIGAAAMGAALAILKLLGQI